MRDGPAGPGAGQAPTHPGELLGGTVIPATGLSLVEVAERLRISRQMPHAVAGGRARVTPDLALRPGRMSGNAAAFWANMQTSHDLWQAGQRNPEVLASIERVGEA